MKNGLVIPTVLVGLLVSGLLGAGILKNKVDNTEKEVEKIEKCVEEAEDKIVENEKIDIEQTVLIEQIGTTLEKLNQKIDKDLE